MIDVVYRIVEHDGGWAYKLGDVFSETFATRRLAEVAAKRVADQQNTPGEDEAISWEDAAGTWHDEAARGSDRPNATVADADAGSPTPRPASARRGDPQGGDRAAAAYDRGDKSAGQGVQLAGAQIRADPWMAALLAVLCGLILGMVLRKRK